MALHLILHSDQAGSHSRRVDLCALSTVEAQAPRVGYISSSPDPERLYFNDRAVYYAEIGAQLCVYVDELSSMSDCIPLLAQCDAIHLSGGNTFTFAEWLRGTPLFAALTRFAESGRPLIGLSAGAIILTKSVASAALCGDARSPQITNETGLALVPFGFWPHFVGDSEDGSVDARLLHAYGTIYACPDGGGVIVNGAQIETFGPVEVLRSDV